MCGCGPRQPLDSDLCDVDSGSRTVTEDSVDYPLRVPMIFTGLSTWPDLTVLSTHLVLSTSLDGSWRRPTLCSRPTLTLMDDLGLFLLIRLCCFHPAWSTRTTTTTTTKNENNLQKKATKVGLQRSTWFASCRLRFTARDQTSGNLDDMSVMRYISAACHQIKRHDGQLLVHTLQDTESCLLDR